MTVMRLVAAAGAGHQLSVIVASRNGVKINAVAAALRQALPDIKHSVIGSDSQSGVADQPFGNEETLRGAYNRVASIALPQHSGSLLVAIEGGVGFAPPAPPCFLARQGAGQQQQRGAGQVADAAQQQQASLQQQLEVFAWVVVQAPGGATSHARSASFPLPAALSELMLREGLELGQADDRVFGRVKSGRGSGTIGQLTGGLLTRQGYYEHAALCALVPLLNPQLWPDFAGLQMPPPAAAAAVEGRD